MSERRFRVEVDSHVRVACNLCGSNGASVRCDKCQSMAFCLSCDDMYHRHPKRRYHLRKAVALDRPVKINDNPAQNVVRVIEPMNNGHPSKMPVPPPRRKKRGITLSSIKETFANTGDKLRRWVSNEKLSTPNGNVNRYPNECRPLETPIIDKPMQTIRTQTLTHNQLRTFPKENSFGTLPTVNRKNSYPPPRIQEPLPAPPPPPRPIPSYQKPTEANCRKASLPSEQRMASEKAKINGRPNVIGVSSSIGDLSTDMPSADMQRKFSVNTFDRRNCSLHDLRKNPSIDDISNASPQPFFPHIMPPNMCYGYPVHPWATSSLNNSIEDMQLNDIDYDSDISARHNSNRQRMASMKRAQSAFHMYPGMGQCWHGSGTLTPVPPYFYPPYYYGHPCSGHTSPMPPYAEPHRTPSFKMNGRGSVDNLSTTSSSRDVTNTKIKIKKKPNKISDKELLSDSGGRSMTSSSRQQSDFDDEDDHFFSVSEDSSDELSMDTPSGPGKWSCKFCTFINDNSKTVCEICSKTNKKSRKTSNRNRRKTCANDNKSKVSDTLRSNCGTSNENNEKSVKNDCHLDFDDRLIDEQKEIEKELIRRLENERRIERQNERIARKEEYLRRKNLGLPIDDTLKEQIKNDQQFDDNDPVVDQIATNDQGSALKIDDLLIVQDSVLPRSKESGTLLADTANKSDDLAHSSKEEKCAKSIECQTEDNSFVDCRSSLSEEWNETTNNEQIAQKPGSDTNNNSSKMSQAKEEVPQNNCQSPSQPPIQSRITELNPSIAPNHNLYDDRRPQYGNNGSAVEVVYSPPHNPGPTHNQMPVHNPYNGYPMNPMMSQMNGQNFVPISPMSPMMSGFPPMVGPVFSPNPLPNMYSSQPYQQTINGSQNSLDRFGFRSNSISSEQSFMSAMGPQFGSRYSSCENLQAMGLNNGANQQKSPMDSGLHLVQVLREAQRNGFTADDVEVAINFSPDKPLDWLEENWEKMCETVLTLSNNQIMQNETKNGNKKLVGMKLLTEEEAKDGLRAAKGNIWQAIDKCVKAKDSKQNKTTKEVKGKVTAGEAKNSLSLKISGKGSGIDNEDVNESVDVKETPKNQKIESKESTEQSEEEEDEEHTDEEQAVLTTISVKTIDVQQIETVSDRKSLERLLNDWKVEKLSSDRSRLQEKEKQKMRKLLELQRKMSEFDSEDSEAEQEVEQETSPVPDHDDNSEEFGEELVENITDDKWHVNSEFVETKQMPANDNLENEPANNEEYSGEEDIDEFISDQDSDLSDEFDQIDARIQKKLDDNFNIKKDQEVNKKPIGKSEPNNEFGEGTSRQTEDQLQVKEEISKEIIGKTSEVNETIKPVDDKQSDSDDRIQLSSNEAKKLMKEIDNNMRRSLEEVELMEEHLQSNETNDRKTDEDKDKDKDRDKLRILRTSMVFDESFQWARTEYECELCCIEYSIDDLVAMIGCTHSACRDCLTKYFSLQIREQQRLVIRCPFCDEPDINPDEDEKVFEYLGLLDVMIKYLVPNDIYELFQRKLRDRALMRDPNFLWCSQCGSGFIAPSLQAKTTMCPDCKVIVCVKCKKKWKKQHIDITCEQFAEWENANDPTFAEQQLDKHLKEFGIECPNCKFRYQLAKGGCMHFRCIQCSYDFCGGCARPFKMGFRCGRSPFCEKLGLHSHHPRNCLFYLRDKDTKLLQTLLDKHEIKYKTEADGDVKRIRCPVMEQKETDVGKRDESCNRYVETAGLCRLHYKEYLGDMIWQNNIDPIDIFNDDELETVLRRENIRLPPRSTSNRREERDKYMKQLREIILDKLPLSPDPPSSQ